VKRDDVATVIVEDCAEIEPPPSDDLQIGEVGMPELVDCGGFVFELIGRLDDDKGWAGDQVRRLKNTIDGSF